MSKKFPPPATAGTVAAAVKVRGGGIPGLAGGGGQNMFQPW